MSSSQSSGYPRLATDTAASVHKLILAFRLPRIECAIVRTEHVRKNGYKPTEFEQALVSMLVSLGLTHASIVTRMLALCPNGTTKKQRVLRRVWIERQICRCRIQEISVTAARNGQTPVMAAMITQGIEQLRQKYPTGTTKASCKKAAAVG